MIKKRYNDFLKLRNVLTDVFYYKIVPVLPPKNLESKFRKKNDFYQKRAGGLKRFLTLVITDRDMFGFKVTRDFFTDENEFNVYYDIYYNGETQMSRIYKSQSKFFSSALRTMKTMTGMADAKPRKFEAKDVMFVQMEQEIDHLESFLSNHLENVNELKKGFQTLKKNYNEVLSMLQDSSANAPEPPGEGSLFRDSHLTDFSPDDLPQADPQIDRLRGETDETRPRPRRGRRRTRSTSSCSRRASRRRWRTWRRVSRRWK